MTEDERLARVASLREAALLGRRKAELVVAVIEHEQTGAPGIVCTTCATVHSEDTCPECEV